MKNSVAVVGSEPNGVRFIECVLKDTHLELAVMVTRMLISGNINVVRKCEGAYSSLMIIVCEEGGWLLSKFGWQLDSCAIKKEENR